MPQYLWRGNSTGKGKVFSAGSRPSDGKGGGGGAGWLVPGPQFSLKIRAPPLDPKLGVSFKFKNLKTALPSGHTTMDQDQLWHI